MCFRYYINYMSITYVILIKYDYSNKSILVSEKDYFDFWYLTFYRLYYIVFINNEWTYISYNW